jgi:hypothetical protein
MTVIIESGYVGDYPLTHARIAHSNNWITGTASASATATGYFADGPNNSLTYERWKPSSSLGSVWQIDAGSNVTVDYCCIGAHTLGTGMSVRAQALIGGVWTDLTPASTITNNSPIFMIFNKRTASEFRINISGGAPEIGVVKFGEALQMQRPFYAGYAPSRTNRQTVVRGNLSEGGQFLGRTKVRNVTDASYAWRNLTADWCDANLPDLIMGIETEPYFLAWRPSDDDGYGVDFAWTLGPPSQPPTNQGQINFRTFGFGGKAFGYE